MTIPIKTPTIIKVAASSNSGKVAGAIAGMVRANTTIEIRAIGAASINRAVQALAKASYFLSKEGRRIDVHVSSFETGKDADSLVGYKFEVIPSLITIN